MRIRGKYQSPSDLSVYMLISSEVRDEARLVHVFNDLRFDEKETSVLSGMVLGVRRAALRVCVLV